MSITTIIEPNGCRTSAPDCNAAAKLLAAGHVNPAFVITDQLVSAPEYIERTEVTVDTPAASIIATTLRAQLRILRAGVTTPDSLRQQDRLIALLARYDAATR